MEDEKFGSNISFYSEVFELNDILKEKFKTISKKIINLLSESEIIDLDNPLIQECIYKSAIFCIQSNNGILTKLTMEQHKNNIKNYALISKSDIQKNFKDINRFSTVLRNVKDFINQLSNVDKEITRLPLEIFKSLSDIKNFKRKLDEIHDIFFDSTELSYLFKKLIWAIFICLVNENELNSSIFDKTKLFFPICQDILIRIPNIFYPTKFGNVMVDITTKRDIIKEYFKKYTSDDINNEEVSNLMINLYSELNIFNNEINLEGEDLSNKEKIENIINKLDKYYEENILNKLNFDQRVLLYFNQNENNSPKIKNNFLNTIDNDNKKQNYLITCNRELFKEENQKSRKVSFNLDPLKRNNLNLSNEKEATLIMTTYTRIWNLLYWAKGVLKNYDEKNKYISNLQQKYKPHYLQKDEYEKFIPINSYANKYMNELIKLLNKYQVNSKFEIDLMQLYIYCLSLLLENDNNIFTENFTALLLYNDDFIKASVALSFELALTIFDITEIELHSIYNQLNLDVYDFWKVILPSNINLYHVELLKHLEEIDYQLTSFLLWRNPTEKFKNELKEFLEDENLIKDEKEKNIIYKLIRHESIQQSTFLCHNKKDFEIPFINGNFKKDVTNKIIFKDCYENIEDYNKINGIGVLIQRLIIYCTELNNLIFNNFFLENPDTKISFSSPIIIDEYIKKESDLLIKVILTNYDDISILWGLHIDQFVLCCIILVLDKYNYFNFSNFKSIEKNTTNKITKNILHNSYNKSKLLIQQINEDSHIFNHVKIYNNQKFKNLIDFYKENFKSKFITYFNDISKIKIKAKIDYFDVQKDLNDLLKLKKLNNITNNINNEDYNDNEFEYLEKYKKKLKVNENKYIIYTNNKIPDSINNFKIPKRNNNNNNDYNNIKNISLNYNKNYNNNNEDSISLLKKLNIMKNKNNQLYFDLFKEEKYCAYRNDNLKMIYNNIIKSELPANEENRKINKEKLNKIKELIIKGKNH